MPREIQEPTVGERGEEEHPAFALIGASRVSSTPGAVLFDSDIRHGHTVVVRLRTAYRQRSLNRDYLGSRQQLFEIQMSEAQWASFVSSMNIGDGVPCTLLQRADIREEIPGLPYAPRLKESMDEVRGAAEELIEEVRVAFEAYREKKTADNLRTLQARIENLPKNATFAAKSLSEHAENVVQRSRADIEAMALAAAHQLGLEPGEFAGRFTLGSGEEK